MNYGYDSLYRLTSEAVSNDPNNHDGTTSYLYDAVGNRQQLLVNGVTANSYTYDADDRLGSDRYDADGNTINSLGTANTYDFENHLSTHGGVTIVYDGDGNRVSKTVSGVTTNYLVDTQNPTGYAQVVDELQIGTVARTYSLGLERISETQTLNSVLTTSFYGYDGHGSVRQLTNSAGTVTDTYDYDAFGNIVNQTGSTPNNYLFAGEQYDPALNLYYSRARYLNATIGRFWSMDTYEGDDEDPTSLHKYLYVAGNPANLTDPSGHDDLAEISVSFSISVGPGASVGAGLGYYISGTTKGAAFGALGGAALGFAFFSGNPQLITQTLTSGIVGVFLQIGVNYARDNYYSVLNLQPPNLALNSESLVVAFGTGASSGLVGGIPEVTGLTNSGAVAAGVQGLAGSVITSIAQGQSLRAGAINAVESFVVGALAYGFVSPGINTIATSPGFQEGLKAAIGGTISTFFTDDQQLILKSFAPGFYNFINN